MSGSVWGKVMGSRWSGGYEECSDISASLIRLTEFLLMHNSANCQRRHKSILSRLINNQQCFSLWSCLHIHVFPHHFKRNRLKRPLAKMMYKIQSLVGNRSENNSHSETWRCSCCMKQKRFEMRSYRLPGRLVGRLEDNYGNAPLLNDKPSASFSSE